MIVYNGLFDQIRQKGLSKTEFRKQAGISGPTMAKLAKNKSVTMATIDKICLTLDCNIGDIMECIPDNKLTNTANNGQGG